MMQDNTKCTRCDGCGRLADSVDREPLTVWERKAPAAITSGMMRTIPCPVCQGTGRLVTGTVAIGRCLTCGALMGPGLRCVACGRPSGEAGRTSEGGGL